jgi:hypothetical protein
LLSFRANRRCPCLSRRLAVEEPTAAAPTDAEPTAPHSIVSGSHGYFCCKCGETENFKNTCKATAAEYAATKSENEAQRTAAHALELARIKAAATENEAAHALELIKIEAAATENEAAHALELARIKAAATENEAAHALELARIKALAKAEFARNVTSIFIACLALAVVSFFSREVGWWVKATVIPLLNSTREKLLLTTGGLVGFVAGLFARK